MEKKIPMELLNPISITKYDIKIQNQIKQICLTPIIFLDINKGKNGRLRVIGGKNLTIL